MAVQVVDFSIIRGTSKLLTMYIVDDSGIAVSLSGYTSIKLYVGSSLNSSSLLLNLTLSIKSGYSASAGVVTYSFSPSDTSALAPGDYLAEFHAVYGSGNEYRSEQPFNFHLLERVKS